jgi:sugar diacid utilization regulator
VLIAELTQGKPVSVEQLIREVQASVSVQVVVGVTVPTLLGVVESVVDIDRVFASLTQPVAYVEKVRAELIVAEITEYVRTQPQWTFPELEDLGELAPSVQAYLDFFGDVTKAAAYMQVHPNTLRYRVRRAAEISGLDVTNPAHRLLLSLNRQSEPG